MIEVYKHDNLTDR